MKSLRFAAVVLVLAASLLAQAPKLAYTVEVKEGDFGVFHHALDIDRPQSDEVRLSVAAWAPGSYRLMNAFKGIREVAAVDENGAAREVRHEGDLTWIVAAKGAARLHVTWRFTEPGKSINNRTYLTETGGLLDGPRNYLYWRDRKELPAQVRFELPKDWRIATGLTPTADPQAFLANDTDGLLDSPVLMGRIEIWPFTIGGVLHRAAFDNRSRPVDFDSSKFVDCCRRIVESATRIWGFTPYPHYTFIFSAIPSPLGGGGLEHLTSTTIGMNARSLASNPNAGQGVISHEFFHAWNVKRLRPKPLGPFDYDGPVRTKSLWISEGLTNYYSHLILSRAGLVDEAGFLAGFQTPINEFVSNPAYRQISPEDCSWTVWDGPYLLGPVSYYTQGEVLGLLMDLEIRGQTKNQKSLDDAMRLLYRRYSGPAGFEPDDVIAGIADSTGVDLRDFFAKHVSGASEIDWAHFCRNMGCLARVVRRPRVAINLEAAPVDGGVSVKVPADSALFRLGLRDGDVVTAVNGAPATTARGLLDTLRKVEVGAPVEVAVRCGAEGVTLKGTIDAVTDVAELVARRGEHATIGRIPADSGLASSGLVTGDVVKAVNGTAVANRDEYRVAASKLRAGDTVKLTIERGGEDRVVLVRASASVRQTFELEPDPAATPLELAIRHGLIESRPSTDSRAAR